MWDDLFAYQLSTVLSASKNSFCGAGSNYAFWVLSGFFMVELLYGGRLLLYFAFYGVIVICETLLDFAFPCVIPSFLTSLPVPDDSAGFLRGCSCCGFIRRWLATGVG